MADSPIVKGDNVLKLTIFINGSEIDESIGVYSVIVHKEINRVPYAKVILNDGDMPDQDFPISNKDDFKPGAKVKINAGYGKNDETIFEGIIIKHGIRIQPGNKSSLEIECKDEAVKMTFGRKNVNYLDQKDSDILSTIIGNHSLSADVESTDTQYPEMVQYYSTDWDFMLSRADANGKLVIVEAGKVSVKKPDTSAAAVLSVTYGDDLIDFSAEVDASAQLTSTKSTAWSISDQKMNEQSGSAPTLNEQGNLSSSDLESVMNVSDFEFQSTAPLQDSELKSWADAQLMKSGLSRIQGNMRFQGNAKAKTGVLIDVQGVGDRFNGSVYVSKIIHEINDGSWQTEAYFGMSPEWFYEKFPNMEPPAASGLLPGVEGLQIGKVMKLDGDPDGNYRIQVSVPSLHADTQGIWARLANFYATGSAGSFFIPEVDDEVILGYLNNDPRFPVILGSLYSSKNTAAYEITSDNYTKAIVTKSNLKIEFDDDKKVTTIETPGGNKIVISDDAKSILLSDQNQNKVELSSSGIELNTQKDIKLTATGKINMTGTQGVEISSDMDVKVSGLNVNNEANVGFTAKGNATAELSASGQTTVKGAMVMIN